MTTTPPITLQEIAALARRSLEPGLRGAAQGTPDPAGSCLYASWLLRMLLLRYSDLHAMVRGGGDGHEGALSRDGAWRGHYWCEVQCPDGSAWVVDITADQFDHEPVRLLSLSESTAWYRPGDQAQTDQAVMDIEAEIRTAQRQADADVGRA